MLTKTRWGVVGKPAEPGSDFLAHRRLKRHVMRKRFQIMFGLDDALLARSRESQRGEARCDVAKRLSPSKYPREGFVVILLLCAVQCLIPTFLTATALAEDGAAPHHGRDSVRRAQCGWVVSPDACRSRPEPGVLISMLEPEVASGSGTHRPGIAPASSCGQVLERSITSRTYNLTGDYVPTSHPVTAPDRKTPRYSLLSWPRSSSSAHTKADEVNRRNSIFGCSELTIADARMPATGPGADFRPLLEIHLGAYKLPVFVYAPNPQVNWPRW